MPERPQMDSNDSFPASPQADRWRRVSEWLSHPRAWARLLLSAVALIAIGLSYGAWDPRSTGIVGVWVAIVGGILLLYGCLLVFPRTLSQEYQEREGGEHPRILVENEIRTTLLQALLAAVVLIGAVSTWQQFSAAAEGLKISRHTQITEQFSNAAEQLGAERIEVRIGAVYTLERLTVTAEGDEGKWDSLTVYRLLAAYIKAHSPWPTRPLDEDAQRRGISRYMTMEQDSLRKRSPDVQLALEVVGAQTKRLPSGQRYQASLTDTDLRGADLADAHLERADLRGSALDYADGRIARTQHHPNLRMALLQKTTFRCAHLEGVDFTDAQLQGADLRDADLRAEPNSPQEDAILQGAALEGALYNDGTQFPKGFNPGIYAMKKDPNLDVMKDGRALVVENGRIAWVNGKRVVRGGSIIEPDGTRIARDPLDEAEVITCSGPEGFRLGVTRCRPRDDRDCDRPWFVEPANKE